MNGLYVRHYDGIESVIPREKTYLLTPEKFESDCQFILQCEESLVVGQAVVARKEQDGMLHFGTSYCRECTAQNSKLRPEDLMPGLGRGLDGGMVGGGGGSSEVSLYHTGRKDCST